MRRSKNVWIRYVSKKPNLHIVLEGRRSASDRLLIRGLPLPIHVAAAAPARSDLDVPCGADRVSMVAAASGVEHGERDGLSACGGGTGEENEEGVEKRWHRECGQRLKERDCGEAR